MASWRRRALAPRVLLGAARRGRLRRAVPAPRMAPRGRRWDAGCAHVDAEHPSFVLRLRNTMLSTLVRYGVSIDASRSDYSGGQKPEAGAGGDERKKEQMKNIMRRLKGIILAAARWTRPPSSTRPLGTSSCSRWRSRSSVCVVQVAKCATGRPDVDSDLAQRLTGTRMDSTALEDWKSERGVGLLGRSRFQLRRGHWWNAAAGTREEERGGAEAESSRWRKSRWMDRAKSRSRWRRG
uniref:Uncharacterized protein n=1 Tax=Oryza nivara TaxID=4536 RepID=A0A0E0HNS5_ORYNI